MNYLAFLLQAVVLWFVLFIILRDGSGRSYSTMFYVSVGITLAVIGLHFAIPRWSLPVAAAGSVLTIRFFCYTSWLRAAIASALFFTWLHFYPALLQRVVPHGALPNSVLKPIDLDDNP